jgi:hypothetical protein
MEPTRPPPRLPVRPRGRMGSNDDTDRQPIENDLATRADDITQDDRTQFREFSQHADRLDVSTTEMNDTMPLLLVQSDEAGCNNVLPLSPIPPRFRTKKCVPPIPLDFELESLSPANSPRN